MPQMTDLTGKVALATRASRGIGRSITISLAQA
jgi:NAD(P)-dependent dehydrogenase (short-subunit alcohol dehydrogenase family)